MANEKRLIEFIPPQHMGYGEAWEIVKLRLDDPCFYGERREGE